MSFASLSQELKDRIWTCALATRSAPELDICWLGPRSAGGGRAIDAASRHASLRQLFSTTRFRFDVYPVPASLWRRTTECQHDACAPAEWLKSLDARDEVLFRKLRFDFVDHEGMQYGVALDVEFKPKPGEKAYETALRVEEGWRRLDGLTRIYIHAAYERFMVKFEKMCEEEGEVLSWRNVRKLVSELRSDVRTPVDEEIGALEVVTSRVKLGRV